MWICKSYGMLSRRSRPQGGLDPRELSALVDRLQAALCRVLREGVRRGDHLVEGKTPNAWVTTACRVTSSSAADRLCVGEQLEEMPRVAQAVRAGEIDYRSASVICHFRDRLREDHHRLLHESGWRVVTAGERVEFVPPDRAVMVRRRRGERRWAA